MPHAPRSFGVKLITGYKLVKAPVTLALALWLSVAPHSAVDFAEHIVRELSEGGATLGRLAHWIKDHLTARFALDAAILAWIDGATTAAEGLLLLYGSAWGEWIVVLALGLLVPIEAVSLERHPSWTRLTVLLGNAAIVAYLIFDRLREKKPASESLHP